MITGCFDFSSICCSGSYSITGSCKANNYKDFDDNDDCDDDCDEDIAEEPVIYASLNNFGFEEKVDPVVNDLYSLDNFTKPEKYRSDIKTHKFNFGMCSG